MTTPRQKKLRIAYLSGPCDGPAVFCDWSQQRQQDYFGTDYMKQFLQLCEDVDADAYVVTSLAGGYNQHKMGRFVFDNHPNPAGLKGIKFHLAFLPWFARVVPRLIRFRPDVLIATDNAAYWFLLAPLRLWRIPIVPSFHPVPWPQYAPRKLSSRVLWQLTRFFVLKHLKVAVVTSNAITRELQSLLGSDSSSVEILRHLPTYPKLQFAGMPPPNMASKPPFRIFFIGRTETDKGIFDIVEVARRLETERSGMFHFDMCGSGGQLDNLRKRIVDLKLENVISCHG